MKFIKKYKEMKKVYDRVTLIKNLENSLYKIKNEKFDKQVTVDSLTRYLIDKVGSSSDDLEKKDDAIIVQTKVRLSYEMKRLDELKKEVEEKEYEIEIKKISLFSW